MKKRLFKTLTVILLSAAMILPVRAESKEPEDMSISELIEAYKQLKSDYEELTEKYNELTGEESAHDDQTSTPSAAEGSAEETAEDANDGSFNPADSSERENNPSQVMESTDSSNVPIWTPNIEGLALVGEYAYPAQYDDELRYVLIFRNNSDKDITFSCKGTARDAEGNIIGTSMEDTESVCSGYEVPVNLRFENVNFYDVIGLNYSMSEVQYSLKPAQNSLEYQTSDLGDRIVVTVTNTGTKNIEFVEANLFYLKDGKMVAQKQKYFDDGSGMSIQPGVPCTETIENPYEIEFDSVLVYFTGRY